MDKYDVGWILLICIAMFIFGFFAGSTVIENRGLIRKCEETNGKYDFCKPITIYRIEELYK